MPCILVVDDNPVDRKLVGALLGQVHGWDIKYASDGLEALERIAEFDPDAIVSDLQMPRKDGLSLVVEVNKRYPFIPVVLITSQGSEEIAIKALKAGASSYSPKRLMNRDLTDTVRRVLEATGAKRGQARIVQRMTRCAVELQLENDRQLVAPLIELLQSYMSHWDESEQLRMGVAIDEALVNAMYHGNLEVSSELREGDDTAFYDLVNQRAQESPYQERRVTLQGDFTEEMIRITIADQGPGFDPSKLPDPTDPENLEKASGRGLLLIRTFTDNVEFNESGNQISMIRYRKRPDEEDGDEDDDEDDDD